MKEINSLYIHFPFCKALCSYCDFYRSPFSGEENTRFIEQYLTKAIHVSKDYFDLHQQKFGKLKTIYLGGGTPSLWGKSGQEFIRNFLKNENIQFQDDYEFTLEMNPGAISQNEIYGWKEIGVNRFSVGIQCLNEKLLPFLDRVHTLHDSHHILKILEGENFSVDLLLGIPFSEGKREIKTELQEVLKYKPKHLSLYILTPKENYKYSKDLPSEEWIENEYLEVSNFLIKNGFDHYEVSNFGQKGFKSQHNLKYWNGESVWAMGPSATGFFTTQNNEGIRVKWKTTEPSFESENLTKEELLLESLYLSLRTNKGTEIHDYFKNQNEKINILVQKWDTLRYLNSKSPVVLSARGYLLLDSLMDDLFNIK